MNTLGLLEIDVTLQMSIDLKWFTSFTNSL
jgi:hypothetical protein